MRSAHGRWFKGRALGRRRKASRRRWGDLVRSAGTKDLWGKETFQEVGSILEISPYGNLSDAWTEIFYFLFSVWGNDAFRCRELILSRTESFKKILNHIKTIFFRKTPFCGYRETFTFTRSLLTSACNAVLCNSFSKIIFCIWENPDCQVTTVGWLVGCWLILPSLPPFSISLPAPLLPFFFSLFISFFPSLPMAHPAPSLLILLLPSFLALIK